MKTWIMTGLACYLIMTMPLTWAVANKTQWIKIEDVCFTNLPNGGCHNKIVNLLNNANQFIVIFSFVFTDQAIQATLLKKKAEGVDVLVIADAKKIDPNKGSQIPLLAQHKAKRDAKHGGMEVVEVTLPEGYFHNKVIITASKDKQNKIYYHVVTGSYNLSQNAENNNAENMVFIESKALALQYLTSICRFLPKKAHPIVSDKFELTATNPGLLEQTLNQVCKG